jgi:cytochrome oxidase Cu insertion factor (SCO1/SenC/PrrC family)
VGKNKQQWQGRWKLLAVLAVCAAPLFASYFTYYVLKPQSRTNYGTLIDPRAYPIPALGAAGLDGKPAALEAFKGKWIMLQVNDADCQDHCKTKLFQMRQLRLTQGKNMERIERVWLITDDQPVETLIMREYDGTRMLRAQPQAVRNWLPTEPGATPADHIYLIDPLGNLMMRFPKDADPNKIKKDLTKLLKASSIG